MPGIPASASERLRAAVGRADEAILVAAARLRSPDRDRVVAAYSRLGNSGVGWVALAGAIALARRDPAPFVRTAAVVWGTLAINYGVKQVVRRERPDHAEAPQAIDAPSSSSFPSAHAAMSAAALGPLGAAAPSLRLPLRVASLAMAASRVYLGVHHPSDVAVGYVLGTVVRRTYPPRGKNVRNADSA